MDLKKSQTYPLTPVGQALDNLISYIYELEKLELTALEKIKLYKLWPCQFLYILWYFESPLVCWIPCTKLLLS